MNDFYLKIRPFLILLIRLVLGGTFIYAAIPKILDPAGFAIEVENYQIINGFLSHYSALLLPWIELYCGILIIINKMARYALIILISLIGIFIIALLSAVFRGLDISCGCFASDTRVSWLRIYEDVVFLCIAFYLFLQDNLKFKS